MNKEKMLELADLIEKQPHETDNNKPGFCFNNWNKSNLVPLIELHGHKCGAPSCIAGWGKMLATKQQVANFGVDPCILSPEVLGLTYNQVGPLFNPNDFKESIFHLHQDMPTFVEGFDEEEYEELTWSYNDVTPKIAADTLRNIANGIIDLNDWIES